MNSTKPQTDRSTSTSTWLLEKAPWAVICLLIGMVAFYAWTFNALPHDQSPEAWGQFGDYVGGLLNPLISLFTLFVALAVWRLQKKEMSETKIALEDQGKTAEQQRREQRFFDFLNLYQHALSSIDVDDRAGKAALANLAKREAAGACFLFMQKGFGPYSHSYTRPRQIGRGGPEYVTEVREVTSSMVISHWNSFSPMLDHFLRTIFAILREAEPTLSSDHFRYVKLFRAQLNRDELNLLALNLLFDPEGLKMRPYAECYGLLKHLQPSALRTYAKKILAPQVFGRQWVVAALSRQTLVAPGAPTC